MENICRKLGKSMEKIRNWFKHQRKREVVQGKRKFNVIEKKIRFFIFYQMKK